MTYPGPILLGCCPSAIDITTALVWSEITLIALSILSSSRYFDPEIYSISEINDSNRSVSYVDFLF